MRVEFDARDLEALLRLNRLRAESPSAELEELEATFDRRFGAGSRLAVYGSLAPGRSNHGELAGLTGDWLEDLSVRGELRAQGWGIHLGFPALRWSANGPPVPVQLLVSAGLPTHWPRLDQFEGPDYERILVPVVGPRGDVAAVANLYQAVDRRPDLVGER